MIVSEDIKSILSKPFTGPCSIDYLVEEAKKGKKLVSIGDYVTNATLDAGIKPFVSVFDFKNLRADIGENMRSNIEKAFPDPYTIDNPAGHFNEQLLPLAKKIMQNGGSVRVNGEEDITGLAFMFYASDDHLIYYGMKGVGTIALKGLHAASIARYLLNKMGLSIFDV